MAICRVTVDKQIKTFQNLTRGIANRCFLVTAGTNGQCHGNLFKPGFARHDALLGVGIKGKVNCLRFNIAVSHEESMQIASALLHISRTISKKHANEFTQVQHKIIPCELKLRGKANWDSTLPTTASTASNESSWDASDPPSDLRVYPSYFTCSKCAHVESSTCRQFHTGDLDVKLHCNRCNQKSKINGWKCHCQRLWHRCPSHRHIFTWPSGNAQDAQTSKRNSPDTASSDSGSARKRQGPDSFEWLQAVDQEREVRKRTLVDQWSQEQLITLGIPLAKRIKPGFLTPRLRDKFQVGTVSRLDMHIDMNAR